MVRERIGLIGREVIRPADFPVPQGIPYSPGIRAGHFVFTSGMNGSDWKSGLAPEARIDPDLPSQAIPSLKQESRYVFQKATAVLEAGGSSADNAVRINHYLASFPTGVRDTDDYEILFDRWRRVNDSYLSVNWFEWSPYDRPASSLLPMQRLLPRGAHVENAVIGIIPDGRMRKESISAESVPGPVGKYPQAIRVGPWVFTAGRTASKGASGLAPEATLNDSIWNGNETRVQLDYILQNQKLVLESVGVLWEDVVSVVVYMRHMADLPAMEEIWRKYFPHNPPARTVIPATGIGVKGATVEVDLIAIVRDGHVRKETVRTDKAPRLYGNLPQAIKAGPFLFFSGQMAANERGLIPEARINPELPYMKVSAKQQVDFMLGNVQAICEAAGTSLENLVRSQCFYTNLRDFAPSMEVWAGAFPKEPPAMTHVEVPSPLPVRGCQVMLDLIAYVPE